MIDRIIHFSVTNKLITGLGLLVFIGWGAYNFTHLPIDALPDVTNNQVLVNTIAPNLATQEVEQFITFPLEQAFKNIPDLVELRSISRSGLSVITVVFTDHVPVNVARQLVAERITLAQANIPVGFGTPVISPATTGLGEIYQYTLAVDSAHRGNYTAMDLRSIQDWIVRRQVLGVPGVVDVSSFGGFLKQYEVAVDPARLQGMRLSLIDVYTALAANNENTGGSYIEKGPNLYFIRGEGLVTSLKDIENIVIATATNSTRNGSPVRIRDIGEVRFGSAPRYGAMTRNGEGETVGAVVLMQKEANAMEVTKAVKVRMESVEASLPEGVHIDPFVDRTKLVSKTITTVGENLLLGALIVVLVLVLLLGNWRAGLLVASVIPLSMLFAVGMMVQFGISANLMSMGALDFGLVVDGAVIIVESLLFALHARHANRTLDQQSMDGEVIASSGRIMRGAVFGQLIILVVYFPILSLIGVEGKMFRPMAMTVSFAIVGALLLSLTYVPLMSSLFLSKRIANEEGFAERLIHRMQRWYAPRLAKLLHRRVLVIGVAIAMFIAALFTFNRLGGEFIPELDEGDFATNYTIRQGSSLSQTVDVGTQLERILLDNFPEVKEVVSKIGTAEVPTDPMPVESADVIIVLKDPSEWPERMNKEELASRMEEKLSVIPGVNLSFEQPIQMRFNELIAGVKSGIAVKIYGDDLGLLFKKGNEVAALIAKVPGAVDVKVEQVVGMPQLVVKYDRERIAQFGVSIADANRILNTALAGGKAGVVYEGERRYDLVVRLADHRDADVEKVRNIMVPLPNGTQLPLGQLASVAFESAPAQVSRDNGERRIVIEANVRGRDMQSVAEDIQKRIDADLQLPAGYYTEMGGTFKTLQEASARLSIAVPIALLLILIMLYLTFRSLKESLIIFSAIPLAAIGGVFALSLRDLNFSISAGIGFIALFGVAVLNGIVLISYFNRLEQEGETDVVKRILKGTAARLRPVLATAAVASLGFLPMAISTSEGSEVQRPLATVVIGGLISSTLLTLVVLPVLYYMVFTRRKRSNSVTPAIIAVPLMLLASASFAQTPISITLDQAVQMALRDHPVMNAAELSVEQQLALQKTALGLTPLSATYNGGQINSSLNDANLQVVQGFDFPTVIARRSQLLKENTALAESQRALTSAELKQRVSQAYMQLAYGNQLVELLHALDSTYSDFAANAQRKFDVGASGRLERDAATAQRDRIRLEWARAVTNRNQYQAELQRWLGSDTLVSPENTALNTSIQLETNDAMIAQGPLLRYAQQQTEVAQAQWRMDRSQWAPSLQAGGFYQTLDHVSPFWGYQVGLGIPLPGGGQGARTKASRLGTEIATQQLENTQRTVRSAFTQASTQLQQLDQLVKYYETQGEALATSLHTSAQRSYDSGDIDYVAYIQGLDQSYRIRTEHLTALLDRANALFQLRALLGQ
ncbi:MAG: CusA/CzcA family heavy metal efflux RND transporter [Flavobacteriales bacterium]|nr:CusA/CzcA family heavy metal efflux RND transporter [Flavobacteriales bacterium]